LAFLLPPGIVGLLAILTVVKGTLLHREPKPAGFSRETPTGLAFPSVQLESGPKARPMDPAWATDLRDQCKRAKVPFFFKQWGGKNKKAAGRQLMGQTYDEMPVHTA
jgi:hypothetical protein